MNTPIGTPQSPQPVQGWRSAGRCKVIMERIARERCTDGGFVPVRLHDFRAGPTGYAHRLNAVLGSAAVL